jgi:hypothetical protein
MPTKKVPARPEHLTERHLDGLDCVYCGQSTPTMAPAPTVDGQQLFACSPPCEPQEAANKDDEDAPTMVQRRQLIAGG